MKRIIKAGVVSLTCMVSAAAFADTVWINAKVEEVLISPNDVLGGCMIRLNKSIQATGLDCPAAPWVTFSCSGDLRDKETGLMMLDTAQMAFALDKPINVRVDDSQKHNGYCLGIRVGIVN